MNIKYCWEINSELNAFTIPIRFINPKKQLSMIKFCLFDTGFTGYFGLDKKTISELDLEQIGQGKAFTISSDINYENYLVQAELIDDKQAVLGKVKNIDESLDVKKQNDISVQQFKLPLIGIKSIIQFSWLILEGKKWVCLIDDKL